MGPINSSESKGKQQEFIQNYEIIQQIQSQRIRFLEHKQTKKQYLLRQLTYDNDKMYQQALQNIKNKKQQLKHADHITAITQYFSKKVDTYCSDFYKIYVLFQYPQRTLDDQINQRNLRKNNFSQTEIWSILASCILGLGHLQKKGIRHSSLKSSMIFLSQEGFIKISDPFTTGCQTNYETLLNKRGSKHIYLSPQQCQSLQNQIISPVINTYKSDIFTLGMIILQCGLLQYQDQCYRDQCSRIHWETLEYNKNRFRRTYSQQLANMLEYMLGPESNNRPEWIELENYVITDNTGSKSFITEGRKSVLIGYSKPVSVNINRLMIDGSQSKIITAQKPLLPVAQKTLVSHNVIPTTINKGLRVSSSKPTSVQKSNPMQIIEAKRSEVLTEFRAPSFIHPQDPYSHQRPINVIPQYPVSTLRPLPTTTFMSPSQNHTILQSPVKASHIQVQVHNNNIINSSIIGYTKRFDMKPLNTSNINMSRPFKCMFPNPFYQTVTKADQNLIELDEEEETSRVVSVSQSQSYQTRSNNQSSQQYSQSNQERQYNIHNNQEEQHIKYSYSNKSNEITREQLAINKQAYQASKLINKINNNNIKSTNNGNMNVSNQEKLFQLNDKQKQVNQEQQKINQHKTEYNNLNRQVSQYHQNKQRFQKKPHHQNYEGEFVVQTFKLGSRYEGYKLNGMRQGPGKFFYQDGGMYDGNWVRNKMQGIGKLYYQSGKLAYQGQWIEDQFKGHGILYNQNPDSLNMPFNYQNFDDVEQLWTRYEGDFDDDSKNGKGILYLSNGQYFEGMFVNDTAQGQGLYTTLNGGRIYGVWDNNRLVRQL